MKNKDKEKKIVQMNVLSKTLSRLKHGKQSIVLCHGCFDLMHLGHIKHLQAAKEMGDVLVVTVTSDEHVKRGPGRPFFNERQRVESIAALDCVDYVAISPWPTAEEMLKLLKPDYYVKGGDFESAKADATGRLQKEEKVVKSLGESSRSPTRRFFLPRNS